MDKYCCFFCPKNDYTQKSIDDECPSCGRPYSFVLTNHPKMIRDFRITKPLDRGFYGAAYIGERGDFGKKYVLKISPKEFYKFFNKADFIEETNKHHSLAQSAFHVVDIDDRFEENIQFTDAGKISLPCYVTVLDYVEGDSLKEYIDGSITATASAVCQIVIDLLRIQAEFKANSVNHNDLHAGNLIVEKLSPEARRPDAIDDSIRVKVIDLGSLSDESKSTEERFGDLLFTAVHVDSLLNRLLSDPSSLEDRDYRVALALQGLVHGMRGGAQNVRFQPGDLIEQVREAYFRASHQWRPWKDQLQLKSFGDHYNAQTIESWYVPKLLVDPENRWLNEVTNPGPQVITGMRGCGKTMLLRALDIHARAAWNDGESADNVIERIRTDRFIGLYVSAQRLLDLREQSLHKIEHPLTRLFVNYALQATRGLLHLKDIEPGMITPGAHTKLASAVSDYLEGAGELRQSVSLEDLEARLVRALVHVIRGEDRFIVKQAPVDVFSHLAEQFRSCSEVFSGSIVFFLLDDVSTRYIELDKIERIISALLFQSPICAFKFTSEWQTIELGLKSPARVHPIRIGRDLSLFDLGADVHQMIKTPGNKGKQFVARILQQRAGFHVANPRHSSPVNILGDVPLEQVAVDIAGSSETSDKRKSAYRGLSCLTNVCVGDIGDVIKLYEEILKRALGNPRRPIEDGVQSECFKDLSAHRLYDINRRQSYFKDHAIAFAQAAHELLIRSFREGKKKGQEKPRLRQYSSIYVRITTDDEKSTKHQIDRLRDLIDAGVFVFAGGSPRTKTKDSNPIQQFILSYRKIYGLSAYIGLSDRDRFELSGRDLEEWLERPEAAKEILLRNQINDEVDSTGQLNEEIYPRSGKEKEGEIEEGLYKHEAESREGLTQQKGIGSFQTDLFDTECLNENNARLPESKAKKIDVEIEQLDGATLSEIRLGMILTGLGFEERTLASNEYIAKLVKPKVVCAVRYSVSGYANEILQIWKDKQCKVNEITYSNALISVPEYEGTALIDVSGLSKPIIFKAIRQELSSKGRVLVCHATAEHHYPLHKDLEQLFAAKQSKEPLVFLSSLAEVLMGEKGPYKDIQLIDEDFDPTRSRALLAFASAKHERLFSLLDRREFDYLEIIAPSKNTPRAEVAFYAADFITQNYQNAKVTRIDTNDLSGLVRYLDEQYLDLYSTGGANLELGLTGSKTQAVAAAILSARRKISQAWYLSPYEFDEKRFSQGVGNIRVFDIRLSV
ncbi:MAG: hypothetical protein ABW090_16030 [Sedimenticola sp.]